MINRLSHTLSITAKMLILTMIIGGTVWFFLDIVQEKHLREIYLSGLEEQFDHRTTEDSLSFESYIKKFRLAVEFFSQNPAMVDFLAKGFPAPQTPPVKHLNSAPAWFPDQQQRKLFSPIQLAFLLDSRNQVREFYMRREANIPEELLKPSALLINKSQNQSLLTTFAGTPYIVSSKKIISKRGILQATLIFVSLIDENFLNHSRGNFIHKHLMSLVLSENERQTILTSTNFLALPPGTSIDNLRKSYLIISRDLFDDMASDLKIRTVFFMPVRKVEILINESLSTSRQQRLILAFSILLASFLTTLLVSRRIRRLTRDFIKFEQRELGLKEATQLKGDEVAILNSRFKALTLEVVSSREIIRNEARQLAKIAETKVKIQNQILDQIHDAIISTDIHHQITSWNSGAERLFGYGQEEAVGQPISTFFSESEYQELSARVDADKATNQTCELDVTLLKKSGELFFGHLSMSQLRNESGTITGFICYTKDITQQKLSESALQVSKQRFQALTESINDWIWEVNQDGIYTYASPRIYDLLGYFPDEIIGTTPFDNMPK
ncbi:MAG: PAS domain S-box protein, partial [Desulfobulbaceae bacterium]|nr:PAS domain S-box protein [Desulfobulbaceae bacterium]